MRHSSSLRRLALLALFTSGCVQCQSTPPATQVKAPLASTDNEALEKTGMLREVAGQLPYTANSKRVPYEKLISAKERGPISAKSFENFLDHLAKLNQHDDLPPILRSLTWGALQLRDRSFSSMSPAEQQTLFRLIGAYARSYYATEGSSQLSELEQTLNKLVELKTVHRKDAATGLPADPTHSPELDQDQNPDIIQTGKVLAAFAASAELTFYNPVSIKDPASGKVSILEKASSAANEKINRIFIVELPGSTQQAPLALYMHADVVDVTDADSWGIPHRGDFTKPGKNAYDSTFTLTLKHESEIGATEMRADLENEMAMIDAKIAKRATFDLRERRDNLQHEINSLKGDHLYGRGTVDDKAAIISSLYSLKVIRELQHEKFLPRLNRPIQLVIETSEETTNAGIEVYKAWVAARGIDLSKQISIGLDSAYPVTIAEKGIARLDLFFPKAKISRGAGEVEISSLHGGSDPSRQAQNQINGIAKIYFKADDLGALKIKIAKELPRFERDFDRRWAAATVRDLKLVDEDAAFDLKIDAEKNALIVSVPGRERVSFASEDASNALVRAYALIEYLQGKAGVKLAANEYTKIAHVVWAEFNFDFSGAPLHLAYFDPFDVQGHRVPDGQAGFMGRLTVVPTCLLESETQIQQVFDARLPRRQGVSKAAMASDLANFERGARDGLQALSAKYAGLTFNVRAILPPRFIDPSSQPYLGSLVKIFQETTGKRAWSYVGLSGTTTANSELGGVNFGPTMPDEKDVYHQRNEFKSREDLYSDLQMFSNMFLEIANDY